MLAKPPPGNHPGLDRTAFGQGAGRVGPVVGKPEEGLDVELAVVQQMVEHARRFGDEGPQFFRPNAVAHMVLKVTERSLHVVCRIRMLHPGVARNPEHAPGQRGGAAVVRGLLDNQRIKPVNAGGQRGSEPRRAGPNDGQVGLKRPIAHECQSTCRQPAVHHELGAGAVGAFVAGEEQRQAGDLVRLGNPA